MNDFHVCSNLSACKCVLNMLRTHVAHACGCMRQVCDDPLEMYQGDLMTVNLNLAGVASSAMPQMCHVDI